MPRDGRLKHAFRRSSSGSLFGQFTPLEVAVVGAAELLGTAIFVFLGCMGLIKGMIEENPSHMQISITFGLAVATSIQIIGHLSKAHLNPSVTICALILGDINVLTAGVYIVCECLGATLGYGMLKVITPADLLSDKNCCALCVTVPHRDISSLQALLAETLVTSVLIFVVCSVWDKRNSGNQDSVPLKFGFTVAAISMAEGHYTGTSMNPARSLGPALWTGVWTQHWVYWVGPITASIFTTLLYVHVFSRKAKEATVEDHDLPLTSVKSNANAQRDNARGSKEDVANI